MTTIVDRDRVSGTITCSGASAENAITGAVLRTAFGLASNVACDVGGQNGYYNQFAFTVALGGVATAWSMSVDYFGEGNFTTVASAQTTGSVVIGVLPGAVSATGAAVGACRPYAFKITLDAADATTEINVAAWKADARVDLTSASVASLSTMTDGIVDTLGSSSDDISNPSVHGRLNAIRDDLVGVGGTDITPVTTVLGSVGGAGKTLGAIADASILAYGLVTTAGGTGTVTSTAFIGRDLINELLIIEDVSSSLTSPRLRSSRTIASFNSVTGACTVAALTFSPAVGDIVWVIPRAQTGP